ncbi:MAG: pyridoxal-phosphate dependent enzyme, partial [Atribacterota bacterium]
MRWPGILEYFAEYLPLTEKTPLITLQEGNTPLISSSSLFKKVGVGRLFFKFEGMNPTGSFKDRGMVVAIAKAKEEGKEVVMCASTGNTSASAAAYAKRAGLSCVVLIPQGKIALFGNSTHCQLGLAGHPQLAHQQHIERRSERLRHFVGDRHT